MPVSWIPLRGAPGLLLAVAVAVAGAPTLASAAEPETETETETEAEAENEEEPVALEMKTELGGEDAEALKRETARRIVRQLRRYGAAIAPQSPMRLTVGLRWRDDARTTYAVNVVLAHDGEVLARDLRFCEHCSTAEVVQDVSFGVAVVMHTGRPTPAPPRPERPAVAPAIEPVVVARRPPRLTGLGWAGVALVGVGVAASAAGGAWWATRGFDARNGARRRRRGADGPATALVAGGATAFAAGIVMIAVDASVQRRRRAWTLTPRFDRRSAGIAISGSF